MTDFVPRTDWRNLGVAFGPKFWRGVYFLTPWGNLIFKGHDALLFSERYGLTPYLRIGPLHIKWVRLRGPAS